MRWSTEILDHCVLLKIEGLFPKVIHVWDKVYGFDNIFVPIIKDEGKYFLYKDVGYEMSPIEMENFQNSLNRWDRNAISFINKSTFRIILPEQFQKFFSAVESIIGARVTPDMLIAQGDVFLQIEFDSSQNHSISRLVLNIYRILEGFNIEVIYYGKQPESKTPLFIKYLNENRMIKGLVLLETKWYITQEQRENENDGIFSNYGIAIPAYISPNYPSQLIFRTEEMGFNGNAMATPAGNSGKLFQISLSSEFFKDMFNEIIMGYYGALFFLIEVDESSVTSQYLVEKRLLQKFLYGLQNHWNKNIRKNHKNTIFSISDFVE